MYLELEFQSRGFIIFLSNCKHPGVNIFTMFSQSKGRNLLPMRKYLLGGESSARS